MITLFGMTLRCFKVLEALVETFGSSFIDLVVCSRDKNIEDDCYDEIKELCAQNNIRFADRSSSFTTGSSYVFAIGWRWLIALEAEKKLIVFHDSLLPKYRGFAPLVNSLINKEEKIGVTALFASKEYDKGDIIYQASCFINYPITINEAIATNNGNYTEVCMKVAELIKEENDLPCITQDETEATYSLWRDEEDYRINWNADAEYINRFINATGYPYKGASTMLDDKTVRIKKTALVSDAVIMNRDPGKIIFMENGLPVVVCKNGLLKILAAEYEDKQPLLPLKKFRSRFK